MPIEFRCHRCQRLLRTADNTAGKQTKCPECGTILDIPNQATPPPTPQAASPFGAGGPKPPPPPQSGPFNPNPYASPVAAGIAPVQMTRGFTPTAIDVGDILSRTWTIFSNNLAQMILGALILILVLVALIVPITLVLIGGIGAGVALANQQNEAVGIIVVLLVAVIGTILLFLVSAWIQSGWIVFLLKIARGEVAAYSDIFRGGPYVIRLFAAGLVFALAVLLGYFLCIVPGVILALMFGEFTWIIVDRNSGSMESLSLSRQLTEGNKLNLFLIMLVIIAISSIAQFVPFAFLFTTPFIGLLAAVTYLRMSGQSTADMLTAPAQAVMLPGAGNPTRA